MVKNMPIYFYIVASIMAVIAIITESEWLMLLSKPSIIPALLIYYYVSEKKYNSSILLIILFIYFASDTLALLGLENITIYMMIIDFLPYILLGKVVIDDSLKLRFKKREFIISSFVFLSLMLTMYFLIESLTAENHEYAIAILVYGLVLAIYVSFSLYNYLVTYLDFAMYILIASLFGLIADIIYIITNMIFYVDALNYIEFVFQIISYFYIVAYFLKRNKKGVAVEVLTK